MQYKLIKFVILVIYPVLMHEILRLRTYATICTCRGKILNQICVIKKMPYQAKIREFSLDSKIEIYMDRQRSISAFRLNINAVKNVSHFALASGALFSKRYHFAAVNMVPCNYSPRSFSSRLPSLTVFLRFPTTRVTSSKNV